MRHSGLVAKTFSGFSSKVMVMYGKDLRRYFNECLIFISHYLDPKIHFVHLFFLLEVILINSWNEIKLGEQNNYLTQVVSSSGGLFPFE